MKNYLLISLCLATFISGYAQTNSLGINIKVYDPISKFKENVDKSLPAGISVTYLRSKETSRYSFGGEFGIAMYSSNDYTLNHRGQDVKVNEEDCFWTIHGVVRYDLIRTEKFASYVEARAGITTFFSSTTPYRLDTSY